jgi:hypothetical protein
MVQYTDHNPETQLNTNIIREPHKYNTKVQYTDHNPETQLNTNIIREPDKYNTMVQYTDHNRVLYHGIVFVWFSNDVGI